MEISQLVRQRCRELAEAIKESGCKLDMIWYISSTQCTKTEYDEAINICNTAACVAGHIPVSHPECIVYPYNKKGRLIDFGKTSLKFLDGEYSSDLWQFLFAEYWSNDKEQAIKRLLHVADRGEVHPDFSGGAGEDGYNWELVLE